MITLNLTTQKRCEMLDITREVQKAVTAAGISHGVVRLWVPHTTAAITINECADPDVPHDLLLALERMVPANQPGFRHGEGNSDAHLKSSMVGCSITIPVVDGQLLLGTWQGVFFCEFDGPRSRKLHVLPVTDCNESGRYVRRGPGRSA
jgi:secondary thiamine-phosphate synthase enzyme